MQKILSLAAALAVLSGSALAADLPYKKERPQFVPPPFLVWTGLYAGLNAGGAWDADPNINTVTAPLFRSAAIMPGSPAAAALSATAGASAANAGFIGGGQIGYNWQASPHFVVGLETDFQGLAADGASARRLNATPVPGGAGNFWLANLNVSRSLDYLGTARARLGFLITPTLLFYGTGGFAYGGASTESRVSWVGVQNGGAAFTANNAFFGGSRIGTTLTGWTAGGGVEWMFLPNWSAKAEYLYYDLGSITNDFASLRTTPAGAPLVIENTKSSTRFDGNIVRAGVNYHFNFNLGGLSPLFAQY